MSSERRSGIETVGRVLLVLVGVAGLGICGLYAKYQMDEAAAEATRVREAAERKHEIDRATMKVERAYEALHGRKEPIPVRVVP
jgi:hypothetical protein